MRLRLLATACVLGLTTALASACSDEAEDECTQDAECGEVVCADGTKIQDCVEGQCVTSSACSQGSGGW